MTINELQEIITPNIHHSKVEEVMAAVNDFILADRKQHELDARQSEVESMGILAVDIPELLPLLVKRLYQIKEQREAL